MTTLKEQHGHTSNITGTEGDDADAGQDSVSEDDSDDDSDRKGIYYYIYYYGMYIIMVF